MNNLKIEYHKNDKIFSVTLIKTGIVAYGDSEIEAVDKLKKMLSTLIDVSYDLYRKEHHNDSRAL
jgi:hypothetical protein